LESLSNIWVKC